MSRYDDLFDELTATDSVFADKRALNPLAPPDELSPAQETILDMLQEGRVTAPFEAEETGYSLQYCREELTDLTKHDHVRKVYDRLYELVDDPREGGHAE